MTKLSLALLAFLAAPLRAEPKLVGTTESLPRNAVTGGGLLASAAGINLNSSVAEGSVSNFTGGGIKLYTGLMNFVAQPGSVVSITSMTKTTGTLTLSWLAPGMDGFQGNVPSGYYRIDASSDLLHVFDPTVFLTEFATAVVVGSSQSYTLTGLLPNTTYYSRVYLSDSRKMVAETSAQTNQSTLANVPVSPVVTAVSASSVTFSWILPLGGAEGYETDSSSTNFAGGGIYSSSTQNGNVVTLTVSGLDPDTVYYFKLGSLNWQSDLNFNTIIATRTAPGGPVPLFNLTMAGDGVKRTVTLTWTNRRIVNFGGVLVQVSTNAITASPASGTAYNTGDVLPDGSVVGSSAALTSYLQTGLTLDATEYFSLYEQDTAHTYSIAVSTNIVLDLPPMAAAGLWHDYTADGSSINIHWSQVSSKLDGTAFRNPASPISWELSGYDVYRATGIAYSNWVWIGSAPVSATGWSAWIPDRAQVYYYKVVPKDAFQATSDSAMAMDSLGNLYAVSDDQVSRIKIPADLSQALLAGGNSFGKNMLVKALDRPQDVGGKVFKSVEFDARLSPTGFSAPFQFSQPSAEVVLGYDVAGGQVVASSLKSRALTPSVDSSVAAKNLAAYYFNNQDYVKLGGQVIAPEQTIKLLSEMLGGYQIRSVVRPEAFNFDIASISNKAITPNGDGLNDTVVFTFDNPMDSSFTGKIFDARGAHVADMQAGPIAGGSLMWDGKASGLVVPQGVYIYQIKAEGKTFNGTVVVIR